ncbi:hypothetical protein ABBQ38_002431 [Trebouxia sp. C0009 RCD-2024]
MLHCAHHVDTLLNVSGTSRVPSGYKLQSLTGRLFREIQPSSLRPLTVAQRRKLEQSTKACLQTAPIRPPLRPEKACSYDVIVLGNLCLDIFVSVPALPSTEESSRRKLLQELTASPPDRTSWEVGGNTNFMIAAARLGMQVASIGHLGPDEYGQFIKDVLQKEGVHEVRPLIGLDQLDESLKQTLLCFVLVAPNAAHSFCSRYDFGPWPLLPGVTSMPPSAWQALTDTRAIYLNGCLFDELPSDMVLSALLQAKNNGAVICFDPGPRSWVLSSGSRRPTLNALLDLSDIVVMTEEEALAVTGQLGAQAAAQWVLDRPESTTQWSIVKQGSSGSVLCSRASPAVYSQPALEVTVGDTVGCGDSFAAAIVMGYIRSHDIPSTMALANAVGAATAMGTGAGTNVASANTVVQLLTEATNQSTANNAGPDDNQTGAAMHDQAYGNAAALQILKDSLRPGAESAYGDSAQAA